MKDQPTVFHITHIKAGSQWVAQVLRECAPHREVPQEDRNAQTLYKPIRPGGVYPGVYLARYRLCSLVRFPLGFNRPTFRHFKLRPIPLIVNYINFQILDKPYIYFVVIRDLRDTLVSLYFSLMVSHEVMNPVIAEQRGELSNLDKETGLIYLIDKELNHIAINQESWMGDNSLLIKYEDLLSDPNLYFEKIIEHCMIKVSKTHLKKIVARNSFEVLSGRKRGEENPNSHFRKGIVGDWTNHFSEKVKDTFKENFGQTLINTGYEKDLNW